MIDLWAITRFLRRRAWVIALIASLIVAAQLPSILSMERTYTAELRLRIERPESVSLASSGRTVPAPLDVETEVERLRGQSIMQRVIEDLGLDRLPEFNPAPQEPGWLAKLTEGLSGPAGVEEEAAQAAPEWSPIQLGFSNALYVGTTGASDVITIAFTSKDPELAAQVPAKVLEAYLDQRRVQADEQIARARLWLVERVGIQRRQVDALDREASRMRAAEQERYAAADMGDAESLALSARLGELEMDRRTVEAALADLAQGKVASPAIDALAPPLLTEFRRDLELQQRTLRTLQQTYGDNHERVVSAKGALDEVRAAVQLEADRMAETLGLQLEAIRSEIGNAQAARTNARNGERERLAREADLQALLVELDQERSKLGGLEDQLRAIETDAALPVAEAEILAPATVPLWPDGRSPRYHLAVSSLAAVGLATAFAYVLEVLDRSVRSQDHFRSLRAVSPGGLVPRLSRRQRRMLLSDPLGSQGTPFEDALRWIALSLRRRSEGRLPRSVLVTSALPGEGKTTLAFGLATTLAISGSRVLLVDADLRRGKLSERLGRDPGPGLADFLCGRATLAEVIQDCPKTGIEFVGRGRRRLDDPLSLGRLKELLDFAEATGRIVLLDTAPVLAAAETAELVALTDVGLLVARWGRTPLRAARLAADRLAEQGRGSIVVAINMVVPRRHVLYDFTDSDIFARTLRSYWGRPV